MKKIDQISHLAWVWQGKPIKLIEMHPKQLNVVKHALNTSKNQNWFGLSKDYWINSIKKVEKTTRTVDIIMNKLKLKY
jgi:hypothetical protein